MQVPMREWEQYTDSNGLLSYPEHNCKWVEGVPFTARLKFEGFERGRSAAHAIWRDIDTGLRYPMFLTFLEEVINRGIQVGANQDGSTVGIVVGIFGFAKRGTNYSIRLEKQNA